MATTIEDNSQEKASRILFSLDSIQQGEVNQFSTKVHDLPGDEKFAFIWYSIIAGICVITSIVLLYITIKVIRKVGTSDLIMPLMLVMLQLSALSKSILSSNLKLTFFCLLGFAMGIADACYYLLYPLGEDELLGTCQSLTTTTLSTLFLALAVVLNLNKWVYFTCRIQAHINIREYEIAEIVAEEKEDQE